METPLLAMSIMTSQILKSVISQKHKNLDISRTKYYFFFKLKKYILLNHAPTSTQLISASAQLSTTPSTLLEPKCYTWLGNFPKFRSKNLKLSILTENWHSWTLGVADLESALRFLKFWTQNPLLGKFGSKKSKLSVLPENWHTWYLKDASSYSNICFLNFQS